MSNVLWNLVCKTDPKFTKNVSSGGRNYTDIDPMWLIMRATELFGPYGSTWGLKNLEYAERPTPDEKNIYATLKATFFYPPGKTKDGEWAGGEFELTNDMLVLSKAKLSYTDDWRKKIETNTLSKAMSKIGFGADVFLGKYDDSRYVQSMEAEFAEPVESAKADRVAVLRDLIEKTKTTEAKVCAGFSVSSLETMPADACEKAIAILTKRLSDAG